MPSRSSSGVWLRHQKRSTSHCGGAASGSKSVCESSNSCSAAAGSTLRCLLRPRHSTTMTLRISTRRQITRSKRPKKQILDQATAARTSSELERRSRLLSELEALAHSVRRSGEDKKWSELATLLSDIFSTQSTRRTDPLTPTRPAKPSPSQKLVIFTEHRDTLNYLRAKIIDAARTPRSSCRDSWRHGSRRAFEGAGSV